MIEIRHAQYQDLKFMHDALYQLSEMHHRADPEYFRHPAEISLQKSLKHYIESEQAFALIATEGEQAVGFVVGEIIQERSPLLKSMRYGAINEIFLLEQYRGGGIGRELLQQAQAHCLSLGATELRLEAWGFNEPALSFYRDFGFVTHIHFLRKKI
ncbi:GNAT family N-acetyltransferase [Aliikangiella coralliicola]|uniref:GNAT family N-acetyltransferase n=1 Tax=Aliikangiella coralliicola TaxID=2592383 RepID=UPI00143DB5DB|nr:GNAT family N-acetyltransferase [Aliikangiella coralliicola]